MTILERLKREQQTMRMLQNKHSNVGAADTEPDSHYQYALFSAIESSRSFEFLTAEKWELYSGERGGQEAARELNEQTHYMVELILDAPLREMEGIKTWAREALWRFW